QVISAETSAVMRNLMRLNVIPAVAGGLGTGRNADVPGFLVGGKTGTAEKVVNGAYSSEANINSFISAFPMDDPQYVMLIILDAPKQLEGDPYATAGYNVAPVTADIIRRIAPMLGVMSRTDELGDTLLLGMIP